MLIKLNMKILLIKKFFVLYMILIENILFQQEIQQRFILLIWFLGNINEFYLPNRLELNRVQNIMNMMKIFLDIRIQ